MKNLFQAKAHKTGTTGNPASGTSDVQFPWRIMRMAEDENATNQSRDGLFKHIHAYSGRANQVMRISRRPSGER